MMMPATASREEPTPSTVPRRSFGAASVSSVARVAFVIESANANTTCAHNKARTVCMNGSATK
jgi:hypothetical protein